MPDDKFILHIGATTSDLDAALNHANAGLNRFKAAIFSLRGAVAGIGVGAVVAGMYQLGKSVADAEIEFQKIHYTLLAVTGSTKAANSEFDFVRKTANTLGLSLQDAASGYSRLAASAYGAGVTTKQLHTAFRGLSEAFTVLHTPAQDTQRVLLQLEQTLSKGKVQTQDLNAITNSLPKVYETAAKAFGVTGAKFQQMLQNGLIPGSEFLIKFSAQLHKEFGPTAAQAVDSLNAQINLLHNSIFELETSAAKAGFVSSLTDAVQSLARTLRDPSVQKGFTILITGIGKVADASVRGVAELVNFNDAMKAILSGAQGFGKAADKYEAPIGRLQTQIGHIKEILKAPYWKKSEMSAMFGAQMPEWTKNTDKLKAKLATLEAQLKKLKSAQLDALTSGSSASHGKSPSAAHSGTSTDHGAGGAPKANPNQTQIESILLQLKKQASEYGKSGTAVALYRLQLAHATPAEIAQAKALANTIETLKQQTRAEKLAASAKQKAEQAAKQHAAALDQEAQALKDQLDPMEPLRRELALYDELLAKHLITEDEWAAATFKVNEQMDALNNTVAKTGKTAKKSTSEVNQFAVQAARNIQGIISNTLQNGFSGGIKSVMHEFEQMLRQMAEQAAAADLGKRLFGNMGGTSSSGSSSWGWVGEIANFASNFFHANGAVFDANGLQRLALGGITTGPTPFMSASGPGVMGEAGPEAVMPLARDSSGRLGVRGGGITINAPITVNTPDAKSFQKAKGQIAADVGATLELAAKRYR